MKNYNLNHSGKFYLLILFFISTIASFSQGSATIRVTHTPGRTIVKGKSIWVIPKWQLTSSSKSNCYGFLEYKVFVKANYDGTALKYKIEVTNKAPFKVFVHCSKWGGGSGGAAYIDSGDTKYGSEFKFSDRNNRLIIISSIRLVFNSSDKQQHGISIGETKYLNCNETPSSYINKLKAENKNKKEITALKNEIRALSSNSEAELIQKIGLLKNLQRIDKKGNYSNTISSLEEKLKNLKEQNSRKKEPEKSTTKYSKDFSDNSSPSNKNTTNNNNNNNNTNSNKKGNQNTYKSKYQNNSSKNSNNNNSNNSNNSRPETYQQKQARLNQAKKDKINADNERKYRQHLASVKAKAKYHKKMEALSKDAMSKFDQAAQGDLMAAGIMKGTYAIALASQGYTDKNAIVGAAANIIGGIMQNAERKRVEEARLAAIAAEKRKREEAKRKFIAKLVRNRKVALARMQTYNYPSFLTEESATSVYFFAMLADEKKLKEDLPEIKITDLIEISRYSDGTWPSENNFKQKLTKYGSYDVRIIGAFTNYNSASKKLEQLIKGFAENGVKIKLVNAAKDFIVEKRDNSTTSNSSNKNDIWGNSIPEKRKETKIITKKTSKTKKVVSIANENGLWGKSITLKKKKEPILAVKKKTPKKKKKDLWGKTIKVEKKKDSTTKKKKIKKGF